MADGLVGEASSPDVDVPAGQGHASDLDHAETWRPGGRICPACGRLRHLACRCSPAEQTAPLRSRFDAVREQAAAARRRRLERLAEADVVRAQEAARRRRIVYRTADQLALELPAEDGRAGAEDGVVEVGLALRGDLADDPGDLRRGQA